MVKRSIVAYTSPLARRGKFRSFCRMIKNQKQWEHVLFMFCRSGPLDARISQPFHPNYPCQVEKGNFTH